MTFRPAYSPEAPEFGCNEHAWKPVILQRSPSSSCFTASQQPVEPVRAYTDLYNLLISLNLFSRGERMDSTEVGPCHGHHTRRAVEFHSAASQRYHCVNETEILRLQMVDVTEHLGFRVMCVEHWVGEEPGLPLKSGRQGQSFYRLQIR